MKRILTALAAVFALLSLDARPVAIDLQPSGEYLFAKRDTCDLYMTVYDPAYKSNKPTIIFVFGGGFIMGDRNARAYLPWFQRYVKEGYRIVTIDYRLGLKGADASGFAVIDAFSEAIRAGVEDLFTATAFLIDNAEAIGVDPSKLVISGSSAGAIISLQAEWTLCNRRDLAKILPEGFRYAGVMSFAGAILSREGRIRYASEPAPTLFFHGTGDHIVNYKKLAFFKTRFEGTSALVKHYAKKGYNYNVFRFEGNQHEIASAFLKTFSEQLHFLEENVTRRQKRIVDATVHDPSIEVWEVNSLRTIYSRD